MGGPVVGSQRRYEALRRLPRAALTRWPTLLLVVAVVAVNLLQQPGRTTFDTKLDLQIAPGEFLLRSLVLWNPDSALGELQNQASGYLFPIGPYYLVGDLLGIPVWVWERLFSALLMLAAFEGMRRLVRAWGGLSEPAIFVAGLAYMLSPRLLSTVGALTGEALPTSVLPWTMIPLVLAARGRMDPRRAIVLSAATIPFMGGQNATEALAALSLPAVFLLTVALPWRRRARWLLGWGGLAAAVSLWWMVPLVFLGRYGAPFLDYVESASTTTDRIGWLAALRGTDHWVTFLALGESSSWLTGLALASEPVLLVSTTVVAVTGLLGLLTRRLRWRRSLVAGLLVGLFALTAGSGAPAGSVLDPWWTGALDGVLAAFRNIHKFDPVVRVVLALGVAAAVDGAIGRLRSRSWATRREWTARVVPVLIAVPVVAALLPFVQGDARDSGGFDSLPRAWHQAARFLRDQPGPVRSLVIPGAGFGIQEWGRTTDEPLQVLDAGAWSARTQTPMMPAGTIRWLDAIEEMVNGGRPDPAFVPLLQRAGITHVVVRNDLDLRHTDAPSPTIVHRLVDQAPGLLSVASYGRSDSLYPAVQIYAVHSSGEDPRVRVFAARSSRTLGGGSESLAPLLRLGAVDEESAMLREPAGSGPPPDVLTDSLQRVERNFGRVHEATSQTMTEEDEFRFRRRVHDYTYADMGPQSVAKYAGISQVVASSSAGYADTLGRVLPEQGPYAALDGSLLTSWVTAPFADPRGSWFELRFDEPVVLGRTTLQFDVQTGAGVRRIAMDTDSGRRVVPVGLDGSVRGLEIEIAPTRSVRFTVLDSQQSIKPVMLNEITIDGLAVERAVRVPGVAGGHTTMTFSSQVQRSACLPFFAGLACNAFNQRLSTDSVRFARQVELDGAGLWRVSGTAVASGGPEVAALFAPLDRRRVRVDASSWFGGDAATVPQNAFDGEAATAWVAASDETRPVLTLRWARKRTISRIVPQLAPGVAGRLPGRILVEADGRTQVVSYRGFATGLIDPVHTNRLRLTLLDDRADEDDDHVPLALSELDIEGLADLRYHADRGMPTGTLCGLGPQLTVDGSRVDTRVVGTIGDVVDGSPLAVEPCGAGREDVRLTGGSHEIAVRQFGGFAVRDLSLTPVGPARPDTVVTAESARVLSWGSTRRSVRVHTNGAAILATTQSLNSGWAATLGGKRLEPVEVDGWMQGWRVPAGSTGDVHLVFTPQRPYLAGLALGLAVMLGIVVLAGVLLVRRGRWQPADPGTPARPAGRALRTALVLVVGVISLPAAAAALVVVCTGDRVRRVVPWLVPLLGAGAAAIAVAHVDRSLEAPGAADILMAIAFGLVAAAVVTDRDEEAADG